MERNVSMVERKIEISKMANDYQSLHQVPAYMEEPSRSGEGCWPFRAEESRLTQVGERSQPQLYLTLQK